MSRIEDSSSGRRWHARVTATGTGASTSLDITLKNEQGVWTATGELRSCQECSSGPRLTHQHSLLCTQESLKQDVRRQTLSAESSSAYSTQRGA